MFFFNSVWKETFLNLEMLPFQENMVKDITIRFKEICFFLITTLICVLFYQVSSKWNTSQLDVIILGMNNNKCQTTLYKLNIFYDFYLFIKIRHFPEPWVDGDAQRYNWPSPLSHDWLHWWDADLECVCKSPLFIDFLKIKKMNLNLVVQWQ